MPIGLLLLLSLAAQVDSASALLLAVRRAEVATVHEHLRRAPELALAAAAEPTGARPCALELAVRRDLHEVVDLLLAAGAEPIDPLTGATALRWVASTEMIDRLLEAGAALDDGPARRESVLLEVTTSDRVQSDALYEHLLAKGATFDPTAAFCMGRPGEVLAALERSPELRARATRAR
jgi:hypothetical protein